jgi:hypothetical protein
MEAFRVLKENKYERKPAAKNACIPLSCDLPELARQKEVVSLEVNYTISVACNAFLIKIPEKMSPEDAFIDKRRTYMGDVLPQFELARDTPTSTDAVGDDHFIGKIVVKKPFEIGPDEMVALCLEFIEPVEKVSYHLGATFKMRPRKEKAQKVQIKGKSASAKKKLAAKAKPKKLLNAKRQTKKKKQPKAMAASRGEKESTARLCERLTQQLREQRI